jgi:hypothetical protein
MKLIKEVLGKISGRIDYDREDHIKASQYKRDEGMWTTDEYLADMALTILESEKEVCDPNTCSNGKCNITGQCINQLYLDSQK